MAVAIHKDLDGLRQALRASLADRPSPVDPAYRNRLEYLMGCQRALKRGQILELPQWDVDALTMMEQEFERRAESSRDCPHCGRATTGQVACNHCGKLMSAQGGQNKAN